MDDRMPTVANIFTGAISGSTISGQWVDLPGGQLLASGLLTLRIESNDRIVKVSSSITYGGSGQSLPSIGGAWSDAGQAASISQDPNDRNKLVFTNRLGARSNGYFENAATVVASDWEGGLRGDLKDNNNTIFWRNSTIWYRRN